MIWIHAYLETYLHFKLHCYSIKWLNEIQEWGLWTYFLKTTVEVKNIGTNEICTIFSVDYLRFARCFLRRKYYLINLFYFFPVAVVKNRTDLFFFFPPIGYVLPWFLVHWAFFKIKYLQVLCIECFCLYLH